MCPGASDLILPTTSCFFIADGVADTGKGPKGEVVVHNRACYLSPAMN